MTKMFAVIAVGLDAASRISKSKMEKAAASVAAAIVGIGLFLAPVENAQAQGSGIPIVSKVTLDECFVSTSCLLDWELTHRYHWRNGYLSFLDPDSDGFFPWEGGYTIVRLNRVIGWDLTNQRWAWTSRDWIEIWVWMGSSQDNPVAYVYDSASDGFYEVDLYVDGYLISGPSY